MIGPVPLYLISICTAKDFAVWRPAATFLRLGCCATIFLDLIHHGCPFEQCDLNVQPQRGKVL
jgi:hypothetical protein